IWRRSGALLDRTIIVRSRPAAPKRQRRGSWPKCYDLSVGTGRAIRADEQPGSEAPLRNYDAAVGAALGADRNFAHALRAALGGGVGRGLAVHARYEGVDRQHHEVIDGCGDDHKRNDGIQEITVEEFAAVER